MENKIYYEATDLIHPNDAGHNLWHQWARVKLSVRLPRKLKKKLKKQIHGK